MTASETQFRKWFKGWFPNGYIHKIPDFKATGQISGAGLPDYLTITQGRTIWYEVKTVPGETLSLHHFTDAQRRVFKKMIAAGAEIVVWVKMPRGYYSCQYEYLEEKKKIKLTNPS